MSNLSSELDSVTKLLRKPWDGTFKGYPLGWFDGITHYDSREDAWNDKTKIVVFYRQWWKRSKRFTFARQTIGSATQRSPEAIRLIIALDDWISEVNT